MVYLELYIDCTLTGEQPEQDESDSDDESPFAAMVQAIVANKSDEEIAADDQARRQKGIPLPESCSSCIIYVKCLCFCPLSCNGVLSGGSSWCAAVFALQCVWLYRWSVCRSAA